MPTQAEVVWDPGFTRYDFGPTHPMSPVRLDLTARLCDAFGLFDEPGVHRLDPAVATDELLETVHSAGYVAAVKAASADPDSADGAYGLGTDDDPAFVGMHDASARVVAGTRDLCEAVWTEQTEHGVNFCGGLHHAMPDAASGFCIYNDVAIGIRWLLDHGVERVAYVDVDVHHGDGVERIFWDDDRVLTVSIHESGRPCSRAPAGRPTSAAPTRRGRPPTSPSRPGSPTRGGCGPSTRPCCRWSGRSGRRSSCRSTGATPTCRTPWRTSP